jgi:hypothetical protein
MIDVHGKPTHVLLTNGYSEILEYESMVEAEKFVVLLNSNSDSGWTYEVITIGS